MSTGRVMEPFVLPLPNNSVVAGIHRIPPSSPSNPKYRPLVVGLHGATYDCHYFDANAKHSASIASDAFGVPFVAIDRPCYGGTGSFLPVPEGSSFDKETGVWLHEHILPALWAKFGSPNGATCIVLFAHSLGAMGGIVAAALHAREQEHAPAYPLAGLIISGLGTRQHASMKHATPPAVPPEEVTRTPEEKDALMFRPGTVDPAIVKLTADLNRPMPYAEVLGLGAWRQTWRDRWAAHVRVPVMFALVELECFWEPTEEHLRECAAAFCASARVDASLIGGAPHCVELSHWSQGWYARGFGFAMECAASFAAGMP
ncbi:hypothetical protein F4677DRAFT_414280 [Hypoxylon crocopeplum]|nr:hypothetical protein F4677DRAFT_414280 [Hypoxylon crocopeplum]